MQSTRQLHARSILKTTLGRETAHRAIKTGFTCLERAWQHHLWLAAEALLREALQKIGRQHPSAALIKALLVNGAVNHSSPTGPGFDDEQGCGVVDIKSSLLIIEPFPLTGFVDGGSKLESHSTYDVHALRELPHKAREWSGPVITIPEGRYQLRATLIYPDPPGERLQNNVNLIVQAATDQRYGNMGNTQGLDNTSKYPNLYSEDLQC